MSLPASFLRKLLFSGPCDFFVIYVFQPVQPVGQWKIIISQQYWKIVKFTHLDCLPEIPFSIVLDCSFKSQKIERSGSLDQQYEAFHNNGSLFSPGGVVLNKFLYWEVPPPPSSNPLPFYIPFFTKKVPVSYTFYWKMVPFSHTLFRTLQPF